ncbi:hypothetical protein [Luteibacter sp. 22Crub2.1]|uniref:hypothetical protein n=1 Tax=Luteibacter sp. 22Crub2.1 TaxID=1283288 RepID=UPI00087F9404|nr:hypothetical protein [Luteibacter sp. 22Crub2.1]SDF57846.1 hypothetical protein SAMN04515659_1275 [Dyella sp. 333MFSha]SKB75900.1 hypothetical protein SAMN05660880_02514 [Luteibacter sp. 22Crub2.1]
MAFIGTAALWFTHALALLAVAVYVLFVVANWFGASTAYWKGAPAEYGWQACVVLYVLPIFGLALINAVRSYFPSLVDSRVASLVNWFGSLGVASAAVLVSLPIASVNVSFGH